MTMKSKADRKQVLRLFCQHCQALRKTFGWETEEVCWYERWFDMEESAICASAQDAADAIIQIFDMGKLEADLQFVAACAGTDDISIEEYEQLNEALDRLKAKGIIK